MASVAHMAYATYGNNLSAVENMKFQIPPRREDYSPTVNYCLSKALNVMTAMEQQRRWSSRGTAVAVAVHPGLIHTDLFHSAGLVGIDALFFGPGFSWAHKNLSQGVSTTIYTLIAPNVPSEARMAFAGGGDGTPGSVYYMNNELGSMNSHIMKLEVIQAAWDLSENLVKKWL